MNIHTSFGFSIELFVIVFSFYCWLITPVQKLTHTAEQAASLPVRETTDGSKPEIRNSSDFISATGDWEKIWEDFKFHEIKKLANYLKKSGFISDSINFKQKGITKAFLLEAISKTLPNSKDEIIYFVTSNGLGIQKNV
ncbi:hypothetical protein G7B40_039915 [Aetokthonos hydrillicola Thurmond2011]|jgi:hypothetical protein|uniref:Uncharacterized protein n=2 Tax=Aetokthonos TaxID=1550243 RepID=A0AAP5II05_9CYAN|nr:hypothetical protein [Aetokthonos hydrillicola]MBW4590111.1 hypothetical protein [Aetokthonos hydrillicola CCALA 1050]MDR9900658.1 hypothetical protein [Aetokthonos hydrillicola Thurmond2011]